MAEVSFEKVTKTYRRGAAPVLSTVDLSIASGELVTLVGPSGCGKSTLLNLIAGFERPTSGLIRIDRAVVNDLSPKDRGAAMVFQSYALYPHLTVRENIAFPLDVAGVDRAAIEERVAETAARLGLTALLERRPKELSGGQRQRVALGRALVRRSRLCLFDEPLSNLDAALREQMRAEIKKLHEELGATFVYVTHDQTEAMTLSDRIVVLSGGRIQQVASPQEIYARPANTFVAGFIGSPRINLVPPEVLGLDSPPDRAIVAGVRPHDLAVGTGPRPERAVAGRVYLVEPTGSETWVTLQIGGVRLVGRAAAEMAPRTGELSWATWEPEKVMLFDEKSGDRIERFG
ncbi:Maltose/maltodextrin transport ATP-binding protein MalK [Minicystis rosea]|nr:Maltose/maltodextrin transport ATP-binding protein MalK [Minicystis rosea]